MKSLIGLGTAMVLGGSLISLSTLIRSRREDWPTGRAGPGLTVGLLVSLAGRGLSWKEQRA